MRLIFIIPSVVILSSCGSKPKQSRNFYVTSPDDYRDSLGIVVAALRSSFCSFLIKWRETASITGILSPLTIHYSPLTL